VRSPDLSFFLFFYDEAQKDGKIQFTTTKGCLWWLRSVCPSSTKLLCILLVVDIVALLVVYGKKIASD
jgi:hypothetical protein